ncbi:MAG: hypothetical protein RXR43_11675 [Sulfolobus sp.]
MPQNLKDQIKELINEIKKFDNNELNKIMEKLEKLINSKEFNKALEIMDLLKECPGLEDVIDDHCEMERVGYFDEDE